MCFFVRLPAGATREDAFQRAEKSLASSRFKGLGRLVLRLPAKGPWLVADWDGLTELPRRAMQALSSDLGTEVVGLERVSSHGGPFRNVQVLRFLNGTEHHGHTVKMKADGVTPVVGDQSRLPSFVDRDQLPLVAKTLQFPGMENAPFSGSEPMRSIRFVPTRALAFLGVFIGFILVALLR
ncbi:MAG TPA: hypothetical protein VIG99_07805 [Myxococcaceae bacterium]